MNDLVKAATILGAAIVCATAIWVYFSPYQTCVRAEQATRKSSGIRAPWNGNHRLASAPTLRTRGQLRPDKIDGREQNKAPE
jgi:hypothetical protein